MFKFNLKPQCRKFMIILPKFSHFYVKNMIYYLLLQDFRKQNDKEYEGIQKVILENDNFVGNGTLTYMDYTDPEHAKRNKIYLK